MLIFMRTISRTLDHSREARTVFLVRNQAPATFTPEPGMRRQVLANTDQLMLIRHYFDQGWVGARHSHPYHSLSTSSAAPSAWT